MLSDEQNERITRASLGMPMGDLLARYSRYWDPIATTGELHDTPLNS